MEEINFGIMSIKEFSKAMKKPESTIRTWRRRNEIPEECFLVIGSTIFIKVNEFMKFLGLTV